MALTFINYPVVRIALCFALGIVVGKVLSPHFLILSLTAFLPLIFLLFATLFQKKKLTRSVVFSAAAYLLFVTLGCLNYNLHHTRVSPNHYARFCNIDEPNLIQVKLKSEYKPSSRYQKWEGEVLQLNDRPTSGKLLVYLRKNTALDSLRVDDVLLLHSEIKTINSPKNPHEFDYASYLSNKGILHRIYPKENEVLHTLSGEPTILGKVHRIRKFFVQKLNTTSIQPKERAIIQALVLGYKYDIDTDTYKAYANAGAIHILAVSGLHVGIIYLFLSALLKPIRRVKYGSVITSLLVVIGLLSYAIFTGASPSVVRAVTMFSFFAFATLIRRRTNSINSLFLSFLFLLLLSPNWLFEVGFQLSYLAVLSIVVLFPVLSRWYTPHNKIVKKIRDIFIVSIAAQAGVFPLSLYYFNQFPGLFLLTNCVVLPFLGVLLIFGIIVVLLSALDLLPDQIANSYGELIRMLNDFIEWVSAKEAFVWDDISISLFMVFGIYILMVLATRMIYSFRSRHFTASLLTILCLLLVAQIESYTSRKPELVIFHRYNETVIGSKKGDSLWLFQNNAQGKFSTNGLKDYKTAYGIRHVIQRDVPAVFRYKRHTYVVVDSTGVYPNNPIADLRLVLSQNPKIHLERLIDSLQPVEIIADGSNFPWYVKRWQTTCSKRELPFHYTGEKGAYIVK